jgi:hypothetical protein
LAGAAETVELPTNPRLIVAIAARIAIRIVFSLFM